MKAFWDGLLHKIGEHAGALLWTLLAAGGPVLTWLGAPTTYTVTLNRWYLAGGVLAIMLLIGATSWTTKRLTRQRQLRSQRSFAPMDELQLDILRFMWNVEDGCIDFRKMCAILGAHPNHVRVACQRLQERGFIACNPETLVQLIDGGRTYAATHGLTDARPILQRAAARAAVEMPQQ